MASILLAGVAIRSATVRLIDFGAILTPMMGASSQRLNRFGNRYALDVELPPLREEPEGRQFTARLELALTQGALLPFPQAPLAPGGPGAGLVNGAVTGGAVLPLEGLTPNSVIRFGQYLSVIHAGRRYLHRAAAETIASGTGTASLPLTTLLRTDLADGDVVELVNPMIEGWVSVPQWDIQLEPYLVTRFSITEAA